jgi:DNA polymerase bacteriophage-type
MSVLHLDFETRSCVDLRRAGLHVYASDPSTDIWCAAYAFDEEEVQVWLPGQPCPQKVIDHVEAEGEVWAHNAAFEIQITNEVATKNHGWPYIYPEQAVCTMAMAYAMGLPGSLEGCAAALGIPEQKDLEGGRLMIQISKPRDVSPDGKITWWDDQKRLARVIEYCKQDVRVERMAAKRMLKLSPYETKVWLLDQKINNRGVHVDIKGIKKALDLVEFEKERLNAEMRRISDNQIATCTATQQIKNYLEMYGINAESIDKPSVVELLANEKIPKKVREVLDLRTDSAKAASSKFEPMLAGANEVDHRVRGCFQYSGANTHRWTGRRIQLHNMKRPSFKHSTIETIIEAVSNGMTAQDMAVLYGPPMTILGDCTRAFLTAAPGKELVACDLNAIEARIVAWLAGQENVLDLFRQGEDVYIAQASDIFSKPQNFISKDSYERQVGKTAILAFGYQGGVGSMQTMCKAYGLKMAPAYSALWQRSTSYQKETAEKNFKSNGSKYEISKEEFIASDLAKMFWREANDKIVEYWTAVEDASRLAVENPGVAFRAGPNARCVTFKKNGSFLWAKLPSNGVICYPYPEIKPTKTPWGTEKQLLTYMFEDVQSRKWIRGSTYGGSIVENLTQSLARDVLADGMLELEKINYPVVLHIHDEAVSEVPEGTGSVDTMAAVMSKSPSWGLDLPLAASGWRGKRYRK